MSSRRTERGGVMVLTALFLAAAVGFSAVAVDVGRIYDVRQRLQAAADAAALAGAAHLPADPELARLDAFEVATANGVAPEGIEISFPDGSREDCDKDGTPGDPDDEDACARRILVAVSGSVRNVLMAVFGRAEQPIAVASLGEASPVGAMRGVVPLGVVQQPFTFGQLVELKMDSGSQSGNFGALALGGSGASNYRQNLSGGYGGWLEVGDWVDTEPGNMVGPTQQGLRDRLDADPSSSYTEIRVGSPRLLYLPVIDSLDVRGRSQVQVVGFAGFFLESVNGGQILGRFLRLAAPGERRDVRTDFGLVAVRLVR